MGPKKKQNKLNNLFFQSFLNYPEQERFIELLNQGANINFQDEFGFTTLHLTAMLKEIHYLMDWLLEHGANPNIANHGGVYPIMLAAQHERADLVEKLIDKGVKLNVLDGKEWSVLDHALHTKENNDVLKILARNQHLLNEYDQKRMKNLKIKIIVGIPVEYFAD